MKLIILFSIIILSFFCEEDLKLKVITSLERGHEDSNSFIRSGIILGEVYLNNFELVKVEHSGNNQYIISLIFGDDKNFYSYELIKKYYPIIRVYELNQVTDKKYVITDTLLVAKLTDTLKFTFNQKRKNSFVIYNDGFKPKNYRIENKK